MIDPDGRDNVIYFLYFASASSHISSSEAKQMANMANSIFAGLGLSTQVNFVDMTVGNNSRNFDPRQIDETDAVAVIGEAQDVVNYIAQFDAAWAKAMPGEGWGSPLVAELSENSSRRGENHGGEWISLNAANLNETAERFNTNIIETGGFLIAHGAGHNTGLNHNGDFGARGNAGSIMTEGDRIESLLRNPSDIYNTLFDFYSYDPNGIGVPRNQDYIMWMQMRFGTNDPCAGISFE